MNYNGAGALDRQPAVTIHREIEIFAPPEVIWEWIRRVDLWADWHPEVSSSRMIDTEAEGARFKWRHKLLGVSGRIAVMRNGREWAWTGNSWGVRADQTFRLEGDFRSSRLSTTVELRGPYARLAAPLLGRYASHWSEVCLGILKTRLESQYERSRAGTGDTPRGRSLSETLRRQADRERGRLGL